jgi:effector-binding domain-containing protein
MCDRVVYNGFGKPEDIQMISKTRLLSIARASSLNIDLLEEYGILKPIKNNQEDLFSTDDEQKLMVIVLLKDLGFSLERILQIGKDASLSKLIEIVKNTKSEIRYNIKSMTRSLSEADLSISLLENLDTITVEESVFLKSVPIQYVVGIRKRIRDINSINLLYEQLISSTFIESNYIPPPIIIYHEIEYRKKNIDVEMAIPLPDNFSPYSSRARIYDLNGFDSMACVVHIGSYQKIRISYAKIMVWIEENDYQPINSHREIFLRSLNLEEENNLVEIQFPVQKVPDAHKFDVEDVAS